MYRTLITCVFVGTVGMAIPAHAARDYPFCQRTSFTGGTPQCSFTSYAQCQASISGVGGDCIRNPRLAYGNTYEERRSQRRWKRAY
ncbi:DUF3551 domain-containing protein [Tardiphaga sp.]|jgi:hypothetical protein|uniref:DUF3551 domain-containing protein n=1 Tax=Tardiphaga sp. TaxID=1926292 RepID=UPI0037D9B34F